MKILLIMAALGLFSCVGDGQILPAIMGVFCLAWAAKLEGSDENIEEERELYHQSIQVDIKLWENSVLFNDLYEHSAE